MLKNALLAKLRALAAVLSVATLSLSALSPLTQAATLVHNVHGYTMNQGERVSFVALEFEQGKITRLHTVPETVTASSARERIDGGGATLLPGLSGWNSAG